MCALLDRPDLRPELRDENGRTALHVAAWFNKVVMVMVKTMVKMVAMIMMAMVMVNIVSMTLRKEQLLAFSPLDLAFLPMIKTTK